MEFMDRDDGWGTVNEDDRSRKLATAIETKNQPFRRNGLGTLVAVLVEVVVVAAMIDSMCVAIACVPLDRYTAILYAKSAITALRIPVSK